MRYFKAHFDSSMMGNKRGVGFVIHALNSRLVAVGGKHLLNSIVSGAEV